MARLPRAVEEQGKRAEELLKQLTAQNPPAAAPDPGITPPAPQDPPVTPAPATPAPAAPPAEPPAAPAPGPAPAAPPPPACPDCAKWEQKYKVLQGKYDAEVPRLIYRTSYLENQIADLKGQIEAAKAAPALPAPPDPATTGSVPPQSATNLVGFSEALKTSNDEAIKNFRENFPDVFAPIAKIFDDFGGQVLKRAEDRIAAIEKTSTETKQGAFVRALNEAHADWQTVCQADPNWPVWLNRPDRYGRKALDVLKDAQARLDAQVVVNLLTDFKKEMGPPPAPTPSTPASSQAAFVTPPSGPSQGPAAATAPAQVEAVSRSEINQFYSEKARGKYRGREKEADAIEAKIHAAMAAGMVVEK